MTVKPPLAYYGGKTTIAARIAALFPPHKHYVEPFAGSLAVLLAKKPSRMETVNDLDRDLITFWRVLRDRPLDLERVCAFTPHLRAEYEACRDNAARLIGVSLEARPALEIISAYGNHAETLLYVDPPYLGSTRNWGNQYRHELRTDDEHRELAVALRAARAAVVLSGYPSRLYDLELFPDWDRVELPSQTSQGGVGSARVEVLWSNRRFPVQEGLFAS